MTFGSIQHAITKMDCQPLFDGSIMVTVMGQLKVILSKVLNRKKIF